MASAMRLPGSFNMTMSQNTVHAIFLTLTESLEFAVKYSVPTVKKHCMRLRTYSVVSLSVALLEVGK